MWGYKMTDIPSKSELLSGCRLLQWMTILALSSFMFFTVSCSRNAELEKQVDQLTTRLQLLEDHNAIRKLHHAYGYYIDKCLYEDVVNLFADGGEVHFSGGVYKGKNEGDRY